MKLTHFWAAVDRLGRTETDKAHALGISERQFRNWKRLGAPHSIKRIAADPDLAGALAQDGLDDASSIGPEVRA